MRSEDEIFKRSHIDYQKLIDYGFVHDKDKYVLERIILNNNFRVIVTVNNKGEINGKIFDIDTDDEYTNYRLEEVSSSFANTVKESYKELLTDIKNNVFQTDYFISEQANRITKLIIEKYHNYPEF